RSMTGYGQGSAGGERHAVAVTLRSVNGRFLDLVVRLDERYRTLEAPLRAQLEEQLERGRVQGNVEVRPLPPAAAPREPPRRPQLEEQLERGRVEVNVEVRPLQPPPARVAIQEGVVEALHRAW